MKIRIWGTRGSLSVSPEQHRRYGSLTTCVEVLTDAGDRIILDAGTGLRELGEAINREGESCPHDRRATILCITHMHLDHVCGLPHFTPFYNHEQPFTLYGAKPEKGNSFADAIKGVFDGMYFPVTWNSLPNHTIHEITPGFAFNIGSARISSCATNHPGGGLAWRIEADGWSFAYTGDHEIEEPVDARSQALFDFLANTDVVLADAQYSAEEFPTRRGWGHSNFCQWPAPLAQRGVKRLFFTHYNPSYTDDVLTSLIANTQQAFNMLPIQIDGAREGDIINKDGVLRTDVVACEICDTFQQISSMSDSHTVLSAILLKARQMGRADAGTIYLIEDDALVFSAAQNDTLFPSSAASKYTYLNSLLPINNASIAGYVACTGEALNLPDVYDIPSNMPFGFNISFDQSSGYRTGSVLALPLVNSRGNTMGVLQLINSQDENGDIQPFTPNMQGQISRLCVMSTIPLERSFLTLDMILRMLRTSSLRDPKETAEHVQRVGSMAAELYHRWAEVHNIDPEELLVTKGKLRLAAMLHDVGKVGIPDAVLKKPGKFDDEERAIMQTHTTLGASLFADASQDIDVMARDIALRHHEKWNGSGYTGSPDIPNLSGEDIPLWARITAIADVYDALVSKRCYKDAWDTSDAIDILKNDAGSHFDPELVELFLEIQDTVEAIFKRFC